MSSVNRREFLKLAALSGACAAPSMAGWPHLSGQDRLLVPDVDPNDLDAIFSEAVKFHGDY